MKLPEEIFSPPVSILVVCETGRKDRLDGVRAVLIGCGGSLNVQRSKDATLYTKWRYWEVLGGPNAGAKRVKNSA